MIKVAIGTGMGGAGPRSLGCGMTVEAIFAIDPPDEARASRGTSPYKPGVSASTGSSSGSRLGRTATPLGRARGMSFAPSALREPALVVFPLAFAAFSLMARGTKPYLSVPEFVNIHSLPMPRFWLDQPVSPAPAVRRS